MELIRLRVLVLLMLFLIVACGNEVEGTDLTQVFVDGLSVGMAESSIDFSNYTKTDRYSGKETYHFEEIVIDVQKSKITYLFSRFDEGNTSISVNGHTSLTSIEEVTELLGTNFKTTWADREQGLKQQVYYDWESHLKIYFVYSNVDQILRWIKIYNL